jgi:hypothetical protein
MDEEQDQHAAHQDRIARFMQSDQSCKRQVTDKERKLFQEAVGRLDKMLSASADMDMQILRAGAERLELLLREISTGKKTATGLKQRAGKL